VSLQEQFILHHPSLLKANTTCLVAVSGGKDSMALLHLCLSMKMKVAVAHCNFQLRNDESMRDEAFVSNICQSLDIPLYMQRFDTKSFATEHKVGTQEAARILRYNFFAELKYQHAFDYVLTAHHASDNIETVLINFMRGTSSKGITGIPEKRDFYVRPLLHISKVSIDAFIDEQGIEYVEDSSNNSDDYTRNFIRHHLLTAMQELSPQALDNFSASIQRIEQEQAIYQQFLSRWLEQHVTTIPNGFSINIKSLEQLVHPALLLKLSLKNENASLAELQKILRAETGAILETERYRILKNREEIVAELKANITEPNSFIIEEDTGSIIGFDYRKYDRTENTVIDKNRFVAMLDYSSLQFPLLVRKWEHGDVFYPFGMSNKKLLSDFLINEKVSMFEKEKVMVVVSNDKIIWVIGYRIDNRFAITDGTTKIFEIRKC
jgi:tRNA(Ile)-lysidine synthase